MHNELLSYDITMALLRRIWGLYAGTKHLHYLRMYQLEGGYDPIPHVSSRKAHLLRAKCRAGDYEVVAAQRITGVYKPIQEAFASLASNDVTVIEPARECVRRRGTVSASWTGILSAVMDPI